MGQAAGSTLDELLSDGVREHATGVAAIDGRGDAEEVTFEELADRAARVAGGLRRLGLVRGDALAVWLPNWVEWLEVLFAAARLGVVVVGVNTRYRRDEIAHIVGTSGARAVVAPDAFLGLDVAGTLAAAAPDTRVVVVPEPGGAWQGHDVDAYRELRAASPVADAPGAAEDPVIAFTTSGTTGHPKLAAHDQASVVRHARSDARAFDVRPGDRTLVAVPMCGAFGFNAATSALAAGSAAVLHERFDVGRAVDAIARQGITHIHGADNMLAAILDHPSFDVARHGSWREGAFANFTNRADEVVRLGDERSRARLTGVYGASELFALLSRWPRGASGEERARGGGVPVDDEIDVRVADPETGHVVGPGQEGELQFRGHVVTSGYLANPEATAAAFTDDGWYRSGDLGQLLPEGGFVYLARLKDSLRLRGFLVDPAEIERRLEAHPAVDLAQVVGTPLPGRGDVAVAFVRLHQGRAADEHDLRAFCAAGIADLKVPERVVAVDEFPVVDGPNGVKIRKTELRDRAAALLDAP